MKDGIVIADAFNKEVRIHAMCSTAMVQEAVHVHHCMPTSAAALGRTLSVTALMASDLKSENEQITCVINGKGEAGTILTIGKGNGDVKGFIANPNVYLVREDGHLDVGKAVGTDGSLTVTRNMGLKEPFTGISQLQSGEIGEDFAYYFTVSEQVPSAVSVGVLVEPNGTVSASGGMIISMMPGAKEETIEAVEKIVGSMPSMTHLISEGTDIDSVVLQLFEGAEILGHKEVQYHCGCSKKNYGNALMTLPDKDLEEMISEGKPVEIQCQYCNKTYTYSVEELQQIKEEKCGK